MQDNHFEKINSISTIKGIVQVGSNTGQECNVFRNYTNRIMCFEPIPQIYEILKSNASDAKCFNFALGDKNEIKKMHIASNNGESSSFLKPKTHTQLYQWIRFDTEIDLEIKRFDSLNIDLDGYNLLVSDTQGYEVNVLKGFGNLITKFDYILVEYIDSELYEGDSSLSDISNYLKDFGFELEGSYPEVEGDWGNAIYTNKTNNMEIEELEHFYSLTNTVLSKYKNHTFFETGTYLGDSVKLAIELGFERVISVELEERLQKRNSVIFENEISSGQVELIVGDTLLIIDDIIKRITERTTFWLDSHQDLGPQGVKKCPLYEEIEAISKSNIKNHTIMIDDIRCISNPHIFPWAEGLSIEGVTELIKKINPDYQFTLESGITPNDILVAYIN